jgi:DNA-binding transcriptional regulator YhcF (GntR family)
MSDQPRIRIDLNSRVPVYRQIIDALRVLLVDGTLAPETQLPSVRRLAMELGVHFNTVGEAYRELAHEGWLNLRHGRGATVVARVLPAAADPAQLVEFRERLRGMVAQMRSAGVPVSAIGAELRKLTEELNKP